MNLNHTALIFGAGKTGRGFAAHLAYLSGYRIILIDKNKALIDDLKKAGTYCIEVIGNQQQNCTIQFSAAYSSDDEAWHEEMVRAPVAFTAVFGTNLEALSADLAQALEKRAIKNANEPLTIITCENVSKAASLLKDAVSKNLELAGKEWLSKQVGFSESIIFKTCLEAGPGQSPLTIRAQNFFELPLDGDAIKAPLHIRGLKPLSNFKNQLQRKIYTYNCINAVITYIGAHKGYKQLYEAASDPDILLIARKAAGETSQALVAEFHLDNEEQNAWVNAAFEKFSNKDIPDPIERNAADPLRKLSRSDRLIGPALLALKHGIYPEGLMEGIIAAIDYFNRERRSEKISSVNGNVDTLLQDVCGISEEEELFTLIKERYTKLNNVH